MKNLEEAGLLRNISQGKKLEGIYYYQPDSESHKLVGMLFEFLKGKKSK